MTHQSSASQASLQWSAGYPQQWVSFLVCALDLHRSQFGDALEKSDPVLVRAPHMNLRLLNAAMSAASRSNHSPFSRLAANRLCQ